MIAANDRVNDEFHVASIYNRMIAKGRELRADLAHEVWVHGTPGDPVQFQENHRVAAQ